MTKARWRWHWLIALPVLGAAIAAFAAPLDVIDAAVARGDYAAALAFLLPRAQHGDAAAEYRLALLYGSGTGVPQNYLLRAAWCHDAAEQGHPPAQLLLARLYWDGIGVPKDRVAAYVWANLAVSRLPPGPRRDDAARFRDYAKDQLQFWQIYLAQQTASAWWPKPPSVVSLQMSSTAGR